MWKNIINTVKAMFTDKQDKIPSKYNDYLAKKAENKQLNDFTQRNNKSSQNVAIYNAKSWAPDLHPNGIEPSSYIENVSYDNGNMHVDFRNGFSADYQDIDPNEARGFATTDSKGRYFNKHFRKEPYTQGEHL